MLSMPVYTGGGRHTRAGMGGGGVGKGWGRGWVVGTRNGVCGQVRAEGVCGVWGRQHGMWAWVVMVREGKAQRT